MKKILVVWLFLFTVMSAFAQQKKIVITGINMPNNTTILVGLINSHIGDVVATGFGTVNNGVCTVLLYTGKPSRAWNDTGTYGVTIMYRDEMYIYTNGRTLQQLGFVYGDIGAFYTFHANLPRVNFTHSTTTLAFKKFVLLGE